MSSKAEVLVGRNLRIGLYALLYAAAITGLVIFGPSEPHVFIYQEF